MTTQIETTDYIHQTGLPMVSLKTIQTELPEGWSDGYSADECEAMLSRMHGVDILIAEYRGKIAGGSGEQDTLDSVIHRLEDAIDQDAYLDICADIIEAGIEG